MKQIENYTDYLITEDGQVFSTKRKCYLKPSPNEKGYLQLVLCKEGIYKTFRIHRLVAENFIPNPENKPQVNHIDGDKSNNHISNLEWATASENVLHSYRKLAHKGGFIKNSKAVACSNGKVYDSIKEAAMILGLFRNSISSVCKGKFSQTGGYKFKYA